MRSGEYGLQIGEELGEIDWFGAAITKMAERCDAALAHKHILYWYLLLFFLVHPPTLTASPTRSKDTGSFTYKLIFSKRG